MTKKAPESDYKELENHLKNYEEKRSDDISDKKTIIWSLYHYYMKLLQISILNYFEIDIDSFVKSFPNLIDRWNVV